MAPCRGDEARESRGRQRLYQKRSTILERHSQRLQTKTMSNQTLPTRTGPARKVWPTLHIMSHTVKQIPAVPVGSADLNQGPTASPMGRGDVIQVLLPNMARTATHKPRTNKDKITFSDLQRENAV